MVLGSSLYKAKEMLTKKTLFGLFLVSLPILYQRYCPQNADSAVSAISASWDKLAEERLRTESYKIAVGVNGNLDLLVSATDLLRALNVTPAPPTDHASLSSLRQLQDVVAYSMSHCAGIERFFANQEVFELTVEVAANLSHKYHVGGNAALIAEKLQTVWPQAQVMLVAPVGPKLRQLLPSNLLTPASHSLEEVHMILEYPVGESWGKVTSSCANRVIYSHDLTNSQMTVLEDFRDQLDHFQPDLIVFSGAHILEGQLFDFREARLQEIQQVLKPFHDKVPVHLELATVGSLEYMKQLVTNLLPSVTSFGLNEQELVAVAKSLDADFDFALIPAKPGVEDVADLLHWLVQEFSDSQLTRVHFHSLSFHIVVVREGSPWREGERSVIAGARVAGLQACDTTSFQPHLFQLLLSEEYKLSRSDLTLSRKKIAPESPLVTWDRQGWVYYLSPVLVCKDPVKTVGLGDAISALGLVHSSYQHV